MESQQIKTKNNDEKIHIKNANKGTANGKKGEVDTSQYTIEERLVSSVWVHERKREHMSITKIKKDFRQRFGKEPPTKNTLYIWEKKLFSTGNVMDAKRTGRPCTRRDHIEAVEKSLKTYPDISSRARAAQLGISRTTIIKIMQEDLGMSFVDAKSKTRSTNGYWLKTKGEKSTKKNNSDTARLQKIQEQVKTTKPGSQRVTAPKNETVKPENPTSNSIYERLVFNPVLSYINYTDQVGSNNIPQALLCNNVPRYSTANDTQQNPSTRQIGSSDNHSVSSNDTELTNNIEDRRLISAHEIHRENPSFNDDRRNLGSHNHTIHRIYSNTERFTQCINGTELHPGNSKVTESESLNITNIEPRNENQRSTITLEHTQREYDSIDESKPYSISINETHNIVNDDYHITHSIVQGESNINVKPLSHLQQIGIVGVFSVPMQIHHHGGYQSGF